MKIISNGVAHAALLILILGYYGWSQIEDVKILRQWHSELEGLARSNNSLVFKSANGVNIYGVRTASLPPGTKRNVVFLLRNKRLDDDLEFWGKVRTILDPTKGIGLIGYCDSPECAESIRSKSPLPFTVLAYGEAVSVQSVVNADNEGNALLQTDEHLVPSKILWRNARQFPQSVAEEAFK